MGEFVTDNGFVRKDTLLATLQDLEMEKQVVQKQYEKRLEGVLVLQQELIRFRECLQSFVNSDLIAEQDTDVSTPAVAAMEEEIQRCQNEFRARTQYLDKCVKQIVDLWMMLGLLPKDDRDSDLYQLYDADVTAPEKLALYNKLVSDDNIHDIEQRIKELETLQQEREFRKQEIVHRLNHLWDRLKVPKHERDAFRQKHNGLKEQDIQEYEKLVNDLSKLKSERLDDFIQGARDDLVRLWDQLYFSREERQQFKPAFEEQYSDTLLDLHEKEISRLQLLVEDRRYILDRIERYMKLTEEVKEFEEITNDPSRLFSRGQRDPGRLLREERFRKRIARELPKVKHELEGALLEFEVTHDKPFCVYGKPYLKEIMNNNNNGSSDTGNSRTPRRHQLQNDIEEEICYSKAATSPRFKSPSTRRLFRTPQPRRTFDFNARLAQINRSNPSQRQTKSTADEPSILHRVRAHNIRKRRAAIAKAGRSAQDRISGSSSDYTFDSSLFSDTGANDENTAPSDNGSEHLATTPSLQKSKQRSSPRLFSDDDDALDFDIFDDGPELSELSADES